METYVYAAKVTHTGKRVKGEMKAENELVVRKKLMERQMYPLSVSKKNIFNSDLSEVGIFKPSIKLTDINFFCKQFAAMVQAGISISRALRICGEQCSNKTLKGHIENLYEKVSEGKSLSEAVRDEKIFPSLLESMIECGEVSGNIDEVLIKTIEHFDAQVGIGKKVKKALTYPAMVVVAIICVVALVMIKVVPQFTTLLVETGAEMPLPTQLVINCSNFCVAHWPIILAVFLGVILFAINAKKIPAVRRMLDYIVFKLPVFGDLTKKNIAANFSSTLSMLVRSGIPMLQAMDITKRVVNNVVAQEELDVAIEALKQGTSLYDALSGSMIYPPIMFSMIHVGEETGALDEMLDKVSVYFKEEVEVAVENMTTMIEPILTIFMAVIIGTILLAILMPTFAAANAVM